MLDVVFALQYLNEKDYDAKKQQEIGALEQTIGLQKEVRPTWGCVTVSIPMWHTIHEHHANVGILETVYYLFRIIYIDPLTLLPGAMSILKRQEMVWFSQHHEKALDHKRKILRDLKRTIQGKRDENGALSRELEELNVSVNERRHISEVNGKWTNRI